MWNVTFIIPCCSKVLLALISVLRNRSDMTSQPPKNANCIVVWNLCLIYAYYNTVIYAN
jgi:hypothetical protein